MDLDPAALAWTDTHPAGSRVTAVAGDAADESVTEMRLLHPIGRVGRPGEA